jgi:hypothetical protein
MKKKKEKEKIKSNMVFKCKIGRITKWAQWESKIGLS